MAQKKVSSQFLLYRFWVRNCIDNKHESIRCSCWIPSDWNPGWSLLACCILVAIRVTLAVSLSILNGGSITWCPVSGRSIAVRSRTILVPVPVGSVRCATVVWCTIPWWGCCSIAGWCTITTPVAIGVSVTTAIAIGVSVTLHSLSVTCSLRTVWTVRSHPLIALGWAGDWTVTSNRWAVGHGFRFAPTSLQTKGQFIFFFVKKTYLEVGTWFEFLHTLNCFLLWIIWFANFFLNLWPIFIFGLPQTLVYLNQRLWGITF